MILRLVLCMFIASILVGTVWGLYDARKTRERELDRAVWRQYAAQNLSHDSVLAMGQRVMWPTTDDEDAAWGAYELADGIADEQGR